MANLDVLGIKNILRNISAPNTMPAIPMCLRKQTPPYPVVRKSYKVNFLKQKKSIITQALRIFLQNSPYK